MSRYFTPPQATTAPAETEREPVQVVDHATNESTESTVYIFPTISPSSAPRSPEASSSLLSISIPTDITLSSGDVSSSRGRSRSNGSRLSWTDIESRPRSFSIDTGTNSEYEVEFWDWTGDEESPSEGSGVELALETRVERPSRWDLSRRHPLVDRFQSGYLDNEIRHQRRWRVISLSPPWSESPRSRKVSNRSGTSSRARSPAPHPALRIPLLSFFSSLLSLDDSTLRLLTHTSTSSHSSPLFPGPQLLIAAYDNGTGEDGRFHSKSALQDSDQYILEKGLRVACDASVTQSNPFVFPALPILGLWSLVSGVWRSTGKVWKGAWSPGAHVVDV